MQLMAGDTASLIVGALPTHRSVGCSLFVISSENSSSGSGDSTQNIYLLFSNTSGVCAEETAPAVCCCAPVAAHRQRPHAVGTVLHRMICRPLLLQASLPTARLGHLLPLRQTRGRDMRPPIIPAGIPAGMRGAATVRALRRPQAMANRKARLLAMPRLRQRTRPRLRQRTHLHISKASRNQPQAPPP